MNIIYLIVGLVLGGGGIYGFFSMNGKKRLKKIEAESEGQGEEFVFV